MGEIVNINKSLVEKNDLSLERYGSYRIPTIYRKGTGNKKNVDVSKKNGGENNYLYKI
jgi:hypothetical protein